MKEIIKNRHSVRSYEDKKIEEEKRNELNSLIEKINKENDLHFVAVYDEPEAFSSFMAHYGKFSGVTNYIALIAKKGNDEKVGYFGEEIVLTAQKLGLNTCWVALTYKKGKVKENVKPGEKLYCTIALGYGKTQGIPHKSKSKGDVSNASENTPEWFNEGVACALYAPTAMNQQKFKFIYDNDSVIAKAGTGFYTKTDLGIAKYHFVLGANKKINWK